MKFTNLMGLSVAMALVACGAPSGTADGGVSGDGGAMVDGGSTGPTTTKTGNIVLSQNATQVLSMTFYSGSATATFGTTTLPAGLTNPCTTTTSGNCTAVRCLTVDAGTQDAGAMVTTTQDSPGTITIAGSLVDGGITLTGNGTSIFTSRVWADGATLTASSSGATVPAFSGKTVTVPGNITVTAPVCQTAMCGSINRGTALPVTWSGGTSGNVSVTMTSSSAAGNSVVSCSFAASAGTGSVPADLLSKFDVGSGYLIIGSSNATDFTAGDYAVKFQAIGPGAIGSVTFQ